MFQVSSKWSVSSKLRNKRRAERLSDALEQQHWQKRGKFDVHTNAFEDSAQPAGSLGCVNLQSVSVSNCKSPELKAVSGGDILIEFSATESVRDCKINLREYLVLLDFYLKWKRELLLLHSDHSRFNNEFLIV
jgi:hypothetical protein